MEGIAGEVNTFSVTGATPGAEVHFVGGLIPGTREVPGCPGTVGMLEIVILGTDLADAEGRASVDREIPAKLAGRNVRLQAVERSTCRISNLLVYVFD